MKTKVQTKPKYNEQVIHDEPPTPKQRLDTMWAQMGPNVCPKLWAQVVREQHRGANRSRGDL